MSLFQVISNRNPAKKDSSNLNLTKQQSINNLKVESSFILTKQNTDTKDDTRITSMRAASLAPPVRSMKKKRFLSEIP